MDEPPVEQWRRETIAAEQAAAAAAAAPVTAEPTVAEPTVAEPNPAEAPNVEPAPVESAPAEPVVGETVVGEQVVAEGLAEPTFAEPTFSEGFAEPAPPADGPGPAAEEVPEDVPLATRVPGANLSHTPTSAEGEPADDGDPMRPYRVHELLTRHSQGVNRGHTNEPVGDVDPVDTATFDTATFDTATFDVGQFDDPATPGGPVAAEPEDLR
jgi:hypothetical protein